jgi:hypothetical protein
VIAEAEARSAESAQPDVLVELVGRGGKSFGIVDADDRAVPTAQQQRARLEKTRAGSGRQSVAIIDHHAPVRGRQRLAMLVPGIREGPMGDGAPVHLGA